MNRKKTEGGAAPIDWSRAADLAYQEHVEKEEWVK